MLQQEIQHTMDIGIIDAVIILQNNQEILLDGGGDLVEQDHKDLLELGLPAFEEIERAWPQGGKCVLQPLAEIVQKDGGVIIGSVQLVPHQGQTGLAGKGGQQGGLAVTWRCRDQDQLFGQTRLQLM
ncbi:MAG: hypothetical protein Kow0063_33720 [Anaerolineae bacterium]